MTVPNMFQIADGKYHVRTQAGFKKVLKSYLKAQGYSKGEAATFNDYPKSYPAIVTFERYRSRYCVTSQTLSDFYDNVRTHIADMCQQLRLVVNQDRLVKSFLDAKKEPETPSVSSFDLLLESLTIKFKSDNKYTTMVVEDLTKIKEYLVSPPHLMDIEKDIISVYWRKGGTYLSIDFGTDGNHTWAFTDGRRTFVDTWNNTEDVPVELYLNLFSNFRE